MAEKKKYTVTRNVIVPVLSFKGRAELAFTVLDAIRTGKRLAKDDPTKEPARIVRVKLLDDGKTYDLIMPTLLASAFEGEKDYVGKSYLATIRDIPGKRYKGVDVSEISV